MAAGQTRPDTVATRYHPFMGPDILIILIIVLIIVLILRGPRTLPKLGEALGRGVREARKEAEAIRSDGSADQEAPGDGNQDGDKPAG